VVGGRFQRHRGRAAEEGLRTCEKKAIGRLSSGTRTTGHRRPADASDWRKKKCEQLIRSYVAAVTLVGTGFLHGSKGLINDIWDGHVGPRLNVA